MVGSLGGVVAHLISVARSGAPVIWPRFQPMKIRLLLPALMFATAIAFGGRFDLPKENPQFSIQMPDNWETAVEGNNVTSRPGTDSKVMISFFPVPAAKNFEDAFAIMLK